MPWKTIVVMHLLFIHVHLLFHDLLLLGSCGGRHWIIDVWWLLWWYSIGLVVGKVCYVHLDIRRWGIILLLWLCGWSCEVLLQGMHRDERGLWLLLVQFITMILRCHLIMVAWWKLMLERVFYLKLMLFNPLFSISIGTYSFMRLYQVRLSSSSRGMWICKRMWLISKVYPNPYIEIIWAHDLISKITISAVCRTSITTVTDS